MTLNYGNYGIFLIMGKDLFHQPYWQVQLGDLIGEWGFFGAFRNPCLSLLGTEGI